MAMNEDEIILAVWNLEKDVDSWLEAIERARDRMNRVDVHDMIKEFNLVSQAYRAAIQYAKDRKITDYDLFHKSSRKRFV